MTNSEIIEKVKLYQQHPYVHPLTCGNNSMHEALEPFESNGSIMLKCHDCDYTQPLWPGLQDIVCNVIK